VSLRSWAQNGWLVKHKTSSREIADLLGVAERDLEDCRAPDLSADWQLGIAYNAALQLATAALVASGYRASREGQHYRVIQSLPFTIGVDADFVKQLDQFRKKRNISDYERAGAVSDLEAKEMIGLAHKLNQKVRDWLKLNHPQLLKG
jgi:hypothetical protein